jgi:hypothetical protein
LGLGPSWLVDQLSAISIQVEKPYSTSMVQSASQAIATSLSSSLVEEDEFLKEQSFRLYAKVFWPLNPVATFRFDWTAFVREVER